MEGLRELLATMSPEEFRAAARERELEEWRAVNRFCGKCGAKMQPHADSQESAFVCFEEEAVGVENRRNQRFADFRYMSSGPALRNVDFVRLRQVYQIALRIGHHARTLNCR